MAEPEPHPLAVARKHAGLTQAELAERVGIHRVTLARLEGGAEPGALALRLAVAVSRGVSELWPLAVEREQGAETPNARAFGLRRVSRRQDAR